MKRYLFLILIFIVIYNQSASAKVRAYGFLSHSAPNKPLVGNDWIYQKAEGQNLFGAGIYLNPSLFQTNLVFFQTDYATAYDVQLGLRRDLFGMYIGKHGAITGNSGREFLSPQYFGAHFDSEWDKFNFRFDAQYGFGKLTHIHPSPEFFYFDIEEEKNYHSYIFEPQFSYNLISKLHLVLSLGLEKYSFMSNSNLCWNIGFIFGDSFFRFFNATRSIKYKPRDSHLIRKPNIYLYPENAVQVDVTLTRNGLITSSIPDYNNGWSVWAEPTGLLDGRYTFLFYEAELALPHPTVGWCVAVENLEPFFRTTLQSYGFKDQEIMDFLDYWLSLLNESPFYEIRPLMNNELETICPITITPQPDNLLRLWLLFTPSEKFTKLYTPLIPHFENAGFVVTEWGGAILE